jgi:transcriptional regulator NrdR family protein
MKCPKCEGNMGVVDSRPTDENTIKRRRKCDDCGFRVTTHEGIGDMRQNYVRPIPVSRAAKARLLREIFKVVKEFEA